MNQNQYSIREMSNFMTQYEHEKGQAQYTMSKTYKHGSKNFQKAIIAAISSGESYHLLRTDKSYYIVLERAMKSGTGFITQGLFGKEIGDSNWTFKPDNRPWFAGADSTDKEGNTYSVKSFLEGDPSLVSLNSLHKTSYEIIRVLSSPLNTNTVKDYLKDQLFAGGNAMSDAFDRDVDKLISILSG